MNTHIKSLSVDSYTLTFEQYQAQPRAERLRLRADIIDRLTNSFKEQQALINQIRAEVEAQFAPQYEGIPCWIPKALTKSGKPDRRYGERRNPAWWSINNKQEAIIKDLCSKVPATCSTFQFPYQFEQVITAWEEVVETPAEELDRLLAHMDWYSHYSDDYSVWQHGEARMGRVKSLIRQLGPDAQAKFNRACPWLNEDGSRKEDAA